MGPQRLLSFTLSPLHSPENPDVPYVDRLLITALMAEKATKGAKYINMEMH